MSVRGLFNPGDRVSLQVVRAERVLPGDIVWGWHKDAEQPEMGYVILPKGHEAPMGAVPVAGGTSLVGVRLTMFRPDALVLVQDLKVRR